MPDIKPTNIARFVTFEGGEGVGKSSQVKRLLKRLGHVGIPAVRTREPGGTPKAEAIRSFILQGRSEAWGPGAEAVLFAAARLDHVNQLITPNLENGRWVVSDRFHDSTRAYQGLTGGVQPDLIDALEVLALNGHSPELTLIMDMDPEKAFQRVAKRAESDGIPAASDRFEKEDIEWHRKLRQAFLEIGERNKDRCVIISASGGQNDIAEQIWSVVCDRFPELVVEAIA